jgi:hypothetical protein
LDLLGAHPRRIGGIGRALACPVWGEDRPLHLHEPHRQLGDVGQPEPETVKQHRVDAFGVLKNSRKKVLRAAEQSGMQRPPSLADPGPHQQARITRDPIVPGSYSGDLSTHRVDPSRQIFWRSSSGSPWREGIGLDQ